MSKTTYNQVQRPTVSVSTMKSIRNCSVQGILINLISGPEVKSFWLAPKESITVSEDRITSQVFNLQKRRVVTISN